MSAPSLVIITASNPSQAQTYRTLIKRRQDHGLYPREIEFLVVNDPEAGRIGSGGGTLHALYSAAGGPEELAEFSAHQRILILHAGGESRRLPYYAPEGKLFAPVPVPSSSVWPPVILDVQLALYLRFPWQDGEVLVTSGDVVIDFDTNSLEPGGDGIAGFAAPAPFEQGARHGVFAFDVDGNVKDYFQKASVAELKQSAALEGLDACALDIGIVRFGSRAVKMLAELGTQLTSSGKTVADALSEGKFSFDLYLEGLIASLPFLGSSEYRTRLGNKYSLSDTDLDLVYRVFHSFSLEGVLTRNCKFLHFGSVREYPAACAELSAGDFQPFYAVGIKPELTSIPASPNSHRDIASEHIATDGFSALVALEDFIPIGSIPDGICLDGRRNAKGRYLLCYGADDSFRPQKDYETAIFCGQLLKTWLSDRKLSIGDIMPSNDGKLTTTQVPFDLLQATLFPSFQDLEKFAIPIKDFMDGYYRIPSIPTNWADQFRVLPRVSIRSLNADSDAVDRDTRRMHIRVEELKNRVLAGRGFLSLSSADMRAIFVNQDGIVDSENAILLQQQLQKTDDPLLRAYRREMMGNLGFAVGNPEAIRFSPSALRFSPLKASVKLDQIVWARSPVRLDLAGGWTDTPPYTNRFGGQVINVAVDLNGQSPIQVFVRRTTERHIRLHSIDLGVTETIVDSQKLQDFRDPVSPFALPKAALCLLGLGSDKAGLSNELALLGCGLEITLLCAVPKGSGLGTSSILAGTILAALKRFFGTSHGSDELFSQVLEMEQMLTTGGGWQDQIGGLVGGVKYIETKPGLKIRPVIHQLDTFLFEDSACRNCMTLFYTGITRLAKNILQEVVEHVNAMQPAYLYTLHDLKVRAQEARTTIAFRDLPGLARVVGQSFRANQRIHPSTSNPEIDTLLNEARPYYQGQKLLGAGGGGFALFISKNLTDAENLRALIRNKYENERSRIVDFSLNRIGLQVTVS